jgi:hypothetical protein
VAGSAVRLLALATICLAADVTFSMSLSNSPFNGISFCYQTAERVDNQPLRSSGSALDTPCFSASRDYRCSELLYV